MGRWRADTGDLLVARDHSARSGDGQRLRTRRPCDSRVARRRALPADRPLDSVNLSPALNGNAPSPRTSCSTTGIVSSGHFVRTSTKHTSSPAAPTTTLSRALFTTHHAVRSGRRSSREFDVAAAHPEIVADLVRAANAHRAMSRSPSPCLTCSCQLLERNRRPEDCNGWAESRRGILDHRRLKV